MNFMEAIKHALDCPRDLVYIDFEGVDEDCSFSYLAILPYFNGKYGAFVSFRLFDKEFEVVGNLRSPYETQLFSNEWRVKKRVSLKIVKKEGRK